MLFWKNVSFARREYIILVCWEQTGFGSSVLLLWVFCRHGSSHPPPLLGRSRDSGLIWEFLLEFPCLSQSCLKAWVFFMLRLNFLSCVLNPLSSVLLRGAQILFLRLRLLACCRETHLIHFTFIFCELWMIFSLLSFVFTTFCNFHYFEQKWQTTG